MHIKPRPIFVIECSQTMSWYATAMKQFRQLFYFFFILCSTCLLQNICFAHLPDLGNEFRSVLPVEKERLMGDMMMCDIRAAGLSHPDPLVHEYVQHIGKRLTPYMSMPYGDMQIKFAAISDKSVNAFAFFGGHVAVHSGLIQATETESELAGVMAHELAHISQQHSIRMMADSKRLMPITIAESIAAIAIGIPELVLPAWANHAQKMLNYSRTFEHEADRIGLQILNNAQFDPQGLPNMLDRMSIETRFHNMPPEYLLTHPLFESRLSDLRNRANSFLFKQKASSNMYHLIKARINVQSATNLQHFIEDHEQVLTSQRYKNKLAADYTYAYALLLQGKTAKAWTELSPLVAAYPDNLIVQITAAEAEVQMHQADAALKRMQHLKELYPDSQAVLLQYATLLTSTKQPKLARVILKNYADLHIPDPQYYECVRQTEAMLGNQIGVYEANAEWYVLHGDLYSAFKQLDLALEQKQPDQKIKNRLQKRQQELTDLLARVKQI